MTARKAFVALLLSSMAVSFAACGGSNSTTSTAPTVSVNPTPEIFEGKVDPGGSAFYSFTVTQTGNVDVMLASVSTSTAPSGTAPAIPLGIGLGTPIGTDCSVTSSINTSAALTSPLVGNMTPGIYCVRVYDIGQLRSTVNFAIRIVHT